ncbi:MAG: polysaccharide deacetylase family protein [Lachnospiraceae bacterium]|nr:polysaccharide deacetylase family protein [Lachnospiraceae bacterium]
MNSSEEPTKTYRIVKYSLLIFTLAFFLLAGSQVLNSTLSVSGKAKKLPIYCVDTEEKKVALSFDAAWGNEDTRNLLAILKKHDVRVTFFMTGEWVGKYPDDVKAIAAAGHDLANHSENHKQMSQLTAEQCRTEIRKVHDRIKELTGVEMTLFRPPYGDYNNTLVEVTNELGYHCVQWDVDSLDWKDYGADSIINTVVNHKHLGNGSIILMHNGAKYTPEALEAVILGLKEKGYTIVPISELIYTENYEMDHEGRQHLKDSVTPSGTTGGSTTVTPTGTPSTIPTVTPVSQITAAQGRSRAA